MSDDNRISNSELAHQEAIRAAQNRPKTRRTQKAATQQASQAQGRSVQKEQKTQFDDVLHQASVQEQAKKESGAKFDSKLQEIHRDEHRGGNEAKEELKKDDDSNSTKDSDNKVEKKREAYGATHGRVSAKHNAKQQQSSGGQQGDSQKSSGGFAGLQGEGKPEAEEKTKPKPVPPIGSGPIASPSGPVTTQMTEADATHPISKIGGGTAPESEGLVGMASYSESRSVSHSQEQNHDARGNENRDSAKNSEGRGESFRSSERINALADKLGKTPENPLKHDAEPVRKTPEPLSTEKKQGESLPKTNFGQPETQLAPTPFGMAQPNPAQLAELTEAQGPRELPKSVLDQIIQYVRILKDKDGKQEMQIDFHDNFFQGMSLKVVEKDGVISVEFLVPNRALQETFKNEREKIATALGEKGIDLRSIEVSML